MRQVYIISGAYVRYCARMDCDWRKEVRERLYLMKRTHRLGEVIAAGDGFFVEATPL